MSILMRGVDMPKNCEECNFKGECRQYWEKIREAHTRPSWCPLVEVADRKTDAKTAECPFDDKIPCEWVCTEYGKCKYKPKTEPQTERSE